MKADKAALPQTSLQPQGGEEEPSHLPPGARLQLRRRQHLPLDRLGDDILRVEHGCVMLQAPTSDGASRLALVLHTGDVISRNAAPPIAGIGLTAATPAVLRRLPQRSGPLPGNDNAKTASDAFAQLAARTVLHAMMLNELTAEARLATFLLELALRFGTATPGGCSFELPLSRTDTAHYLALNPDTLSRLTSRLRAQHIVVMPSRGWATVPDLSLLAALTPLAPALLKLWPPGKCGSALLTEAEATG